MVNYINDLDPSDTYYRMTDWGASAYPSNMSSIVGFYDVKGYLNPVMASSTYIYMWMPLDKRAQLQNIRYYLVSSNSESALIQSFEDSISFSKAGEITDICSDYAGTDKGTVYIYEAETNLGDAWIVTDLLWNDNKSQEEILKDISASEFFIDTTAVVEKCTLSDEEEQALSEIDAVENKNSVYCIYTANNKIIYDVYSEVSGVLVTAELYYPGWKVYVNGQQKTVLQVDGTNRGVIIPSGASTVEFRFEPWENQLGIALQIMAVSAIIILCFYMLKKQKRIPFVRQKDNISD